MDWTLEQPGWLGGFAILGFAALWLRSPSRPRVRLTSTLAVWRELKETGERTNIEISSRLPRTVLLALLGLGVGVLALAGPVRRDRSPESPKRLVVSMHRSIHAVLADFVSERGPDLGEFDEVVLGGRAAAPFLGFSELESQLRNLPPSDAELGWAAYDRPGCVLVLEREPSEPIRHARWFVPKRASRPGWVAVETWWDGEQLERRDGPASSGRLSLSGEVERIPLIAEFARTYAQVRGLDVVTGDLSPSRLRVTTFEANLSEAASCERSGVEFTLGPGPNSLRGEQSSEEFRGFVIARDKLGEPVVLAKVGRLCLAAAAWQTTDQDPARVALALAGLFDEALGPPPGVEAFEDRRAQAFRSGQGSESSWPPLPPRISRSPAVVLATIAGVLLLASALLGRRPGKARA